MCFNEIVSTLAVRVKMAPKWIAQTTEVCNLPNLHVYSRVTAIAVDHAVDRFECPYFNF
jgi:hypothetical protein